MRYVFNIMTNYIIILILLGFYAYIYIYSYYLKNCHIQLNINVLKWHNIINICLAFKMELNISFR